MDDRGLSPPYRWRVAYWTTAILLLSLAFPTRTPADVIRQGSESVRVRAVYKHYADGTISAPARYRLFSTHPVPVSVYCYGNLPIDAAISAARASAVCREQLRPSAYTVVDQQGRVSRATAADMPQLVHRLIVREVREKVEDQLRRRSYSGAFASLSDSARHSGIPCPDLIDLLARAIRESAAEDRTPSDAVRLLELCNVEHTARGKRKLLGAALRTWIDRELQDRDAADAGQILRALARAGLRGDWVDLRRAEHQLLSGGTSKAVTLARPLKDGSRYRARATRVLAEAEFRLGRLHHALEHLETLSEADIEASQLGGEFIAEVYRDAGSQLRSSSEAHTLLEQLVQVRERYSHTPGIEPGLRSAEARAREIIAHEEDVAELRLLLTEAGSENAGRASTLYLQALVKARALNYPRERIDPIRVGFLDATLTRFEAADAEMARQQLRLVRSHLTQLIPCSGARALADRASRLALRQPEHGSDRLALLAAAAELAAASSPYDTDGAAPAEGGAAVEAYLDEVGRLADLRLTAGKRDAALGLVAAAERRLPDSSDLGVLCASVMTRAGWDALAEDAELALKLFNGADRRHPGSVTRHIGAFLARRLLDPWPIVAGALAILMAGLATRFGLRLVRARRRIAEVRVKLESLHERPSGPGIRSTELALLRESRLLGSRDPKLLLREAHLLLERGGDPEDVLRRIERVCRRVSAHARALRKCSRGDLEGALRVLRGMKGHPWAERLCIADAIRGRGDIDGLALERSRILIALGREEDAVAELDRALEHDSTEAVADLRALLAWRSRDAQALARAGRVLIAARSVGEGFLSSLVSALEQLGASEEARELLAELDPTEAVQRELARVEKRLKRERSAERLPQLERRAVGGDESIVGELIDAYRDLGRAEDALRMLQHLRQGAEPSLEHLRLMGFLYLEHGQPGTACRVLKRYLDSRPDDRPGPDCEVMYALASAFEQQELSAAALEWYRRIYEVDIDFADVEDKISMLEGSKEAWGLSGPSERVMRAEERVSGAGLTDSACLECALCGAQNHASSKFCRSCGVAMEAAE